MDEKEMIVNACEKISWYYQYKVSVICPYIHGIDSLVFLTLHIMIDDLMWTAYIPNTL